MLEEESEDSAALSQLMHTGKEAKIPLASSHHKQPASLSLSSPGEGNAVTETVLASL